VFLSKIYSIIVALYSVWIVTNSQSLFLPFFIMNAPKKFYRTGLKFLSLINGRRCDCSFSPLHFTHPCNDIFWWISVLYHLKHCTLKKIHKDRNVCIF